MPLIDLLPTTAPLGAAATLAVALGCGLLVGVERERRKGQGPHRAFAGLRSFTLAAVLGAAATLTGLAALVITGVAFLAGLALLAYARDRSDDPGVTTEIALVLTYLIGVLCVGTPALAAALAVGLTALLAARQRLHHWAVQWLRPGELRDGTALAALVLMALPLVPDQALWGGLFNPHALLRLLAVLLLVQSLAHVVARMLSAHHAVAVSSLASGFVSSTATIALLGLSARQAPARARQLAGGGLLSCVATLLQALVVAAAVQPAWLPALWLPCLAAAALALVWGLWLVWQPADAGPLAATLSSPHVEGLSSAGEDRMFQLGGAAAVAGLLAGVQLLVRGLQAWLGAAGLWVGALLAALADLHAALAAVFLASVADDGGRGVVALVVLVHAASKSVAAGLSGGARYLAWLAPGLWLHTLLAVALLLWA
jgi:uncharacterized membrane protein (DUF4010 family)